MMIKTLNSENAPNNSPDAGRSLSDSNQFAPINEEEKSKLFRLLGRKFIFICFLGVVLAFIGVLINSYIFPSLLFIVLILILSYTVLQIIKCWKISRDIREGRKQIVVARVEEKGTTNNYHTGNNGRYIRSDPKYWKYWMRFNGVKFELNGIGPHVYLEVGDLAELHIAPHSKSVVRDPIAAKPKNNLIPSQTNYPVLYQFPDGNTTNSNNLPMYLNKNNQSAGPYSAEQVLALLNSGQLSPFDMAIRHGEQQWQPLNVYFVVRQNQ